MASALGSESTDPESRPDQGLLYSVYSHGATLQLSVQMDINTLNAWSNPVMDRHSIQVHSDAVKSLGRFMLTKPEIRRACLMLGKASR